MREVFVADTDEEAWRLSVGGHDGPDDAGVLPAAARQHFGFLDYLKHDQSVPDSDVTPEYCAQHNWLIGSPRDRRREARARSIDEVGGFGTLLVFGFDYADQPEAWHRSMRLLAEEVMPKLKHLRPKLAPAAA